MNELQKFQHSVSSALRYSHNIRLTALRTVSCYGVSGLAESRREKDPARGSAQTGERASFGLESAANK
jgi:hypothetical protein